MFAASKGAGRGRLVAETFTANATWTAPAGLTQVLILSGFGGDATPDVAAPNIEVARAFAFASSGSPTLPTAPFALWQTLESDMNAAGAIINANSGTNLLTLTGTSIRIAVNSSYRRVPLPADIWITGNYFQVFQINSHPSSGNILYSEVLPDEPAPYGWGINADSFDLGSNGAPSTALGQSFPGGTLGGTTPYRTPVAPSTTTFNNVTVTPGASYPIVVPSGGSVTISYQA
jgi:hypothetical protein